MIRVNLLEVPPSLYAGRPWPFRFRASTGSLVKHLSGRNKVLSVVVFTVVCNVACWYSLHQQNAKIQASVEAAQRQNRSYGNLKLRYQTLQQQADTYRRRDEWVQALRARCTVPAALLVSLGNAVAVSPSVWLQLVRDEGDSVEIDGKAASPVSVADFIRHLREGEMFREVRFKEVVQDDSSQDTTKEFSFSLACDRTKF